MPASEWKWRRMSIAPKRSVDCRAANSRRGSRSRTAQLARVGYLYLRDGEWNGRQILSRGLHSIGDQADRPAQLRTLLRVFLGAATAGEHFMECRATAIGRSAWATASCWSVRVWILWRFGWAGDGEIAVARRRPTRGLGEAGRGFLPSGRRGCPRVCASRAGTTLHIRRARSLLPCAGPPPRASSAAQEGGDNWPITWADDGDLYTVYGDGNGFEPVISEKLSLGFARWRVAR